MKIFDALITTGDSDGIGLEVTKKSLRALGPQKNIRLCIFKSHLTALRIPGFKTVSVSSPEEISSSPHRPNHLYVVSSDQHPGQWVETAARYCTQASGRCLITAPMSKGHRKEMEGHTEILKRVSGANEVFMGFIGRKFNVVLATGHIPLNKVGEHLSPQRIERATRAAICLAHLARPHSTRTLPVGVLGLNPHSGESGLISSQDNEIFQAALRVAEGFPLEGPLVPDAAFVKSSFRRFACFLALYHDQGLIPFKCVHGISHGIQLSLGIPFIRTSVDHGTAKDLYGKNTADFRSMKMALQWAFRLVKAGKTTTF